MESSHLVIFSTSGKFIRKFNPGNSMLYVALTLVKHYFGQGPGANTNHLKGELDCNIINCKTGAFLRLFTSMFTKEAITIDVFAKKINSSMGNI